MACFRLHLLRWLAPFAFIPILMGSDLTSAEGPPMEKGPFRKPDLVELIRLEPKIHLDIRYSTTNNFIGRAVYPEARVFLQRPAAEAVVRVHRSLRKKGYGIVVMDGYRPWRVTKIFWDAMPQHLKQFVADPRRGSVHSRGCAVDLTLYELAAGKAVEMPSFFDEWTERSRIDYSGGSNRSRSLRDLLRVSMEKEGFIAAELEWWHYTFKDWEHYGVLNLDFREIPAPPLPKGEGNF